MTDTIQSAAAEELHRVMNVSQTRDPEIGESLEESPEALRAAARPFTPEKRRHRKPTAADEEFVKAINE